jgi:hypothetical protein
MSAPSAGVVKCAPGSFGPWDVRAPRFGGAKFFEVLSESLRFPRGPTPETIELPLDQQRDTTCHDHEQSGNHSMRHSSAYE